jgi:mannose-6-phosphate isomerase-like protein (cupin superfamily)
MQKWTEEERYEKQSELIRKALVSEGHALDTLLEGMRESGESAVYLCGSRLDHDFCFGSEDVGVLLSVLPEDSAKAAVPGCHPGSTEAYVTFQGHLTIEYLDHGRLETRDVEQYETVVLPPGQCHRIQPNLGRRAASIVVKTNLSHEPGVVRCAECGYFSDPADCSLHRSWKADDV